MSGVRSQISECTDGHQALAHVWRDFCEPGDSYEIVRPDAVPAPFDRLLVHDEHMTERLRDFHGVGVELRVLAEQTRPELYSREILLTLPGSGQVVEYGVARVHLGFVADPVRAEVLARRRPLGDILVQNDVLRRIEPKWFYRFSADANVVGHFRSAVGPEVYGRVGTIFCDDAPAIELLEIVSGVRS